MFSEINNRYPRILKSWLLIGVVMVFFQVVIGGITRLTGSGLSITKWEIVTGSLPPLNAAQWEKEFDLYKETPQYKKINEGMSMSDFKFIYFWEYVHRLWARLMGFVFLIPFLIFWRKGWIDPPLMKKLLLVVVLAALVASLGWIMVASGLVDRPWVNAYKLTLHLSFALVVFGYLLWTTFFAFQVPRNVFHNSMLKNWSLVLFLGVSLQIILGGVMSGMKAALLYPTWPMMYDSFIPTILFDASNWQWQHLTDYDKNPFMPTLIQVAHRLLAYLLVISGIWYFFKGFKQNTYAVFKRGLILLIGAIFIQVLLGIFTLVNSKGNIPVGLGVMHQAGALIVLGAVLFLRFQLSGSTRK